MAFIDGLASCGWPKATTMLSNSLIIGILALLLRTIWLGYRARVLIRRLKASGIPMMPHSLLLGHIPIVTKLLRGKPADLHPNYTPQYIHENWRTLFNVDDGHHDDEAPNTNESPPPGCPQVFYVDLWPLGPVFLYTVRPEFSAQSLNHVGLERALAGADFFQPLTQGLDLVSSRGAQWKTWRTRLSPGFSARSITAMMPMLLEEVLIFVENLRKKTGGTATVDRDSNGGGCPGAWGDVFVLENMFTDLTMDIIARAALDIRLDEQTSGKSLFRKAFMENVSLCMWQVNFITFWKWVNPYRHWVIWRNNRLMRAFVLPKIHEKIAAHTISTTTKTASRGGGGGGGKTVIDLALKEYLNETPPTTVETMPEPDAAFIDTVIAQLKIFMFAGHDTTATSICWILYDLHRHPAVLARLRAEHDAVFGPLTTSPSTSSASTSATSVVASQLLHSPHLLLGSALPYTTAVVKESLRLYCPAGSVRDGSDDLIFTDPTTGTQYPTAGTMIWDGVRAAAILGEEDGGWYRAREFLPERWLADEASSPLPKNAFRTFGMGPRNCIGQELAMAEMKLVLIFMARWFDIRPAVEEWDAKRAREMGVDVERLTRHVVDGNRLYQYGSGTPHPKDGMPSQVRFAC